MRLLTPFSLPFSTTNKTRLITNSWYILLFCDTEQICWTVAFTTTIKSWKSTCRKVFSYVSHWWLFSFFLKMTFLMVTFPGFKYIASTGRCFQNKQVIFSKAIFSGQFWHRTVEPNLTIVDHVLISTKIVTSCPITSNFILKQLSECF